MYEASMAVPHHIALATETPNRSMAKKVQPVLETNSAPESIPHGVNTCSTVPFQRVASMTAACACTMLVRSNCTGCETHLINGKQRECREDQADGNPAVEVERRDPSTLYCLDF